MHPLDMPTHVHLLLGLVRTMRALKLRILAAFPLLMVPERALQLVLALAVRAKIGAVLELGVVFELLPQYRSELLMGQYYALKIEEMVKRQRWRFHVLFRA